MDPQTSFIRRLATWVRSQGREGVRRKVVNFLGTFLALVPVLLARLLRPFILIRFGVINSNRIGHFILDAEIYLCERELVNQKLSAIDIFGFSESVSNTQLKIMCQRVLLTSKLGFHLDRVNRLIPGGKKNEIQDLSVPFHFTRDLNGLLRRSEPHLPFTDEEEWRGRLALENIGISKEDKFICFNARDSAYLKAVYPLWDWSYHDYRNSNINQFLKAADQMTKRGTFAVRMGSIVKEKIKTHNPMIIDYATRFRTDFLDIYLSSKCHFFLTTGTGLDSVAMVFRRPIVYVNFLPLESIPSWSADYLAIPKKLWLTREKRYMKFREILDSGVGRFQTTQDYRSFGLEVVENSPEEILDVVLEMDERLKGTWKDTKEEEELQKKFWSLFKSSPLHGAFLARIGAKFLSQNRELLD